VPEYNLDIAIYQNPNDNPYILIRPENNCLAELTEPQAQGIIETISELSGKKFICCVWYNIERPSLHVESAQILSGFESLSFYSGPVYYRFYSLASDSFSASLQKLWASFDQVLIYPLDSAEEFDQVVQPHLKAKVKFFKFCGLCGFGRFPKRIEKYYILLLAYSLVRLVWQLVTIKVSEYQRRLLSSKTSEILLRTGVLASKVSQEDMIGCQLDVNDLSAIQKAETIFRGKGFLVNSDGWVARGRERPSP